MHKNALLPALEAAAQQTLAYLENWFSPQKPHPAPLLLEAMRYSLFAQGKCFRAFLSLESARLLGADVKIALPLAAAIETLHCYSLIHDDLPAMDNSPLRRGKPSSHIQFDEATAILAGDALLTEAFHILAAATTITPAARCLVLQKFALASGYCGMIGGQMLDIKPAAQSSVEQSFTMQSLKTGALIAFSCEATAFLQEHTHACAAPLKIFGEKLGLIFQIADDILDREASHEILGKPNQQDAQADKQNFVTLLGIEGAKKEIATLQQQAHTALKQAFPAIPDIEKCLLWQALLFAIERNK